MIVVLSLTTGVQDTSVGARAKAMGGGYTAFEDDPLSVWCNPAGMATQSGGVSLGYQTFTAYKEQDASNPPTHIPARLSFSEPGGAPSSFGAVWQIGSEERPQAVGISFVSPMFLKLAFDGPDDAASPNVWASTQGFYRIRLAYARDFRFKPVGSEGWLSHLALGLGGDVGFSTLEMRDLVLGDRDHESRSEYGGGFGFLLGLFDNTRTLKINLGISYQSAIGFDFTSLHTQDPRPGPAFNWPDQLQIGALVYLLEGLPLRMTAEVQFVGWRGASDRSEVPGVDPFRRTAALSLGAEYRIAANESTALFPRLGLRRFEAPWRSSQRSRLPAFDEWQLTITTRDSWFLVVSAGLGVSFTSSSGMVTSLDVSFETGGDAPALALGVSVGF